MGQPFSLGRLVLILLPALPPRWEDEQPQPRERAAHVTLVHGDDCANVLVLLDDATDANTKEDVRRLQDYGFGVNLNDRFASKTSVTFGDHVTGAKWPPFVGPKPEAKPPVRDGNAQAMPRPDSLSGALEDARRRAERDPEKNPSPPPAPPVASPVSGPAAIPDAPTG